MSQSLRIWTPSSAASQSPSHVWGPHDATPLVTVWAIHPGTDKLVWTFATIGSADSCIRVGSLLIVGASDGATGARRMYALHVNDGSVVWQVNLDTALTGTLPCMVTADSGSNIYVTADDGIRQYTSAGALSGTFSHPDDSSYVPGHVYCDQVSNKLVSSWLNDLGTGSAGGYQIIKFDTSLTSLAYTAAGPTGTGMLGYAEGTTFDDVWGDDTDAGGVAGWWLDPPQDEPSLPPGFPPSYVDRRTAITTIGNANAPYVVGEVIYVGEADASPTYEDVYVKKYEGNTVDGVTETWNYPENGAVYRTHKSGASVYVACGFFDGGSSPSPTNWRSLVILDETDGSLQKQYVLGDSTGLGAGKWIHGGSTTFVTTDPVPRVFGVAP